MEKQGIGLFRDLLFLNNLVLAQQTPGEIGM